MIFSTIKNEARTYGVEITNIFSNIIGQINNLRSKDGISFTSSFNDTLEQDINALEKYIDALAKGMPQEEAFNNTMLETSEIAQQYVQFTNTASLSTDEFTKLAVENQISLQAQNKSFGNVNVLLNEYNSGMKNCGLSQTEFISSVSKSNAALGKYLSGLYGTQASMHEYIISLVSAKVATVAFQVATMALNAAITMGVSFVISEAISSVTDWAKAEKEAREAALETGEAAKQEASNLIELYNAYSKANIAYHNNTGSKETLNSATDELLKSLGVEKAEIQELIEQYGNLDDAINNIAKKELEEKLSSLTSGYKAATDELKDSATLDISAGRAILDLLLPMPMAETFGRLDFDIRDKKAGLGKNPDYRFVNRLQEYGYSSNYGKSDGYIDLGDNTSIEGIIEMYQKLIDMREVLDEGVSAGKYTREELVDDDLYNGISGRINALEQSYENFVDYINQINEIATQLQYMDYIEANGVPETIDEFNTLKQTLLDTAESSGQYVGSNDQINDSIINSLAAIPELSEFFDEYADSTDAVIDKAQAVKKAFGSIFQDTKNTSEMYQNQATYDRLVEWYDSLSDDNKELVYEITLNTDTAQWGLEKWKQALEDAHFDFADLMAEEDTDEGEGFKTKIDNYVTSVTELKTALTSLNDGSLDKSDLIELFEKYPELAKNTDNLSQAIVDQIKALTGYENTVDSAGNTVAKSTGIISVFQEAFGRLDSEEDVAQLQAFMDTVLELGDVVGSTEFTIDIQAETTGMENLWTAIKDSASSTGLTAESVNKLKARYQELDDFDAARLFEKTTNGIHLNTKALRELESEYENQKKIEIDNNLQTLTEQYNDLTEQINSASNAAATAELYAQRKDILDQINDTAELAAMYEGLTSAFYKWEQAQSLGEEGDMYDSLASSLENIEELYNEGLIGTNKFRTAVQLMSNEDLSTASIDELIAAYDSGYDKMTRYFQDSSDGCINFLQDVQKLNQEWAHMNEDGSWEINFGLGNDQEIADALGINVEAIQAVMRKLSDYGFDINLDSIFSNLDLLMSYAEKANEKLKELGKTDITFNFGTDKIEYLEEQIEQAQTLLDEFKNSDGTIDLKLDGAEEAQTVLVSLISQKQLLSAPEIMSLDITSLQEADNKLATAISSLQEFISLSNDIEIQRKLGIDTTESQQKLQSIAENINNIPSEIKTKLGIDSDEFNTALEGIIDTKVDVAANVSIPESSISTVQTTINGIHAKDIEVLTNSSQINKELEGINKYTIADKRFSITVKDNASSVISRINTFVQNLPNDKTITISTINRNIYQSSKSWGTAFARGNWGTKESGIALGGEIGEELVVRNGKFFTIGENSAELFAYEKGDIIFNAEQTRQILANGKIKNGKKRGVSYAEGTAFSSGSGKITGKGTVKTTASGSSSSSGNSSSESSSNSSSESENEPETIDWIEIAINRIERAIDRLKTTATSTYKALKTKLGATYDEISKVNQELSIQQKAYNRYIKQANSVGLSSNLAAKVQNGTIDISEYDKDTADLIKEYQEWYEKALDCSDAIQDLHENLASLYEDNFNNVKDDFENQLDLLDHLTNTYETGIDEIETRGYLESTKYYAALQDVEKQNIAVMKKELSSLTQYLSEAMESGEIEKYSDAWYSMQTSINEVKEAIADANVQLIEYANTMREIEWGYFDFIQDRISQITQESDFLIDLMSNKKLYQDSGQFSNEGLATMGLHAQNYNVYMAQADQYADELRSINKELANDPYNTILIERREELLKLQQESILAAEDEKQAIIDMVEEGIKIELENLKELIDTYKDGLDSAKDLYDYQKKVEEKSKDIAVLQKQLSAYENDTSEETRTKIQQIKVDLANAQEDLAETEYEQFISDTKSLLDNLYTEYETILNERLDNVDALLADMIDMVNVNATTVSDALNGSVSSISEILNANTLGINETLNGNASSIKETLERISGEVGYTMSSEMKNIWSTNSTLGNVVSAYGDNFTEKLTTINAVLSSIQANTAAMVAASNQTAQNTVKTTTTTTTPPKTTTSSSSQAKKTTTTTTTPPKTTTKSQTTAKPKSISVGGKVNAGSALIYDYAGDNSGERQYFSSDPIYTVLKEQNGYLQVRWHKLSSGITGWFKKSDVKAYKTGGLVNYTGLAQLDGTPGKPELVLNAEDTKNFIELKDVLRTMSTQELTLGRSSYGFASAKLSGLTDISDILANIGRGYVNNESSTGDVNIDIMIDHVDDYNDFITKLQKDRQFESMIRSMTTDQLSGGSSLAKNKYRWSTQK